FAALQLDDDTHAGLVRLVANVGNTLDFLLVDQLGDLLDQRLLVNLIGNRVDDQSLAATLFHVLEVGARTHDDTAAPRAITLTDAHYAVDQRCSREVRRRNVFDQVIDTDRRIFEQSQTAGNDLIQIVR